MRVNYGGAGIESSALSSAVGTDINYYLRPMSWDVGNIYINQQSIMRDTFKVFADQSNYPVSFHCRIGTDRTGLVAFYLLALLGVNQEDIYRDYLFSNYGNIGGPRDMGAANAHTSNLSKYSGSTMKDKAWTYFKSIGLTDTDLNNICNILLEK